VDSGGQDSAEGTDAFTTFGGVADMAGVIYYGSSAGWYVDLSFTGLDPTKLYSFATSACRAGTTTDYDDRWTIFTISGVDAATSASTAGTQVYQGNPNAVWFNTGKNLTEGYVARWTNIAPGADGRLSVRAEAHPSANSGYKAYAFSVFQLQQIDALVGQYSVAVNVTGHGTVQRDPDRALYASGEVVHLTAVPASGWAFVQWSGDDTGTDNPCTLTMTRNMTVGAQFALVTGVNPGEQAAPLQFALRPGSPNPASHALRLRYELPRDAHVTLRVYDLRGRLVDTLVNGFTPVGRHEVAWVTDAVASGVYYCRFDAPGFRAVQKLVVLK
jgi:hypothetical protein